jgi:hypothetical protein
MTPIRSQKKIADRSTATLKERGISLITGIRNGKTVSMYAMMEAHTTLEEFQKKHPIYYREPKLVFVEHVRFAPHKKTAPESIMRMVLQALGIHSKYYNTYDVRTTFADEMLKAQSNNIQYVIPIDNAENLRAEDYTSIKVLNEFRSKKHDVGLAFVIAGQRPAMFRMPYWFHEISDEIVIDKAAADEIATIIDELYPEEKKYLYPHIVTLSECATTGVMKKVMRRMVSDVRTDYVEKGGFKETDLLKDIAKLNEQVRIAA